GTDGVSLEIEKWATVLERNGYRCFYFAGELDRDPNKSFLVEEAHFNHPFIKRLNDYLFRERRRKPEISNLIHGFKEDLKSKLYEFYTQFDIDLIIPENALSIPMNIPLGLALTEFIAETDIPTIAHHHDFYWERKRFFINSCQDYLRTAFPPDLPSMRHVVINSIASKQLSYRLGISNTIIPNVYDFSKEPTKSSTSIERIRKDTGLEENEILIMQPTRVVPRKMIERSIEIARHLDKFNPVLVVTHPPGDEGDTYRKHIMEYAERMDVKIIWIDHLIGSNNAREKYTLEDIYHSADIVTYPSSIEGFGNAFLEAIYYKKPIVVNRYSVYVMDIEPRGFNVISFDDFVTIDVIRKIEKVLTDADDRRRMVEHNYRIAKNFFSYEVLEQKLLPLFHTF
ncbi:MAG: glycosyltransferase family 1 protein, partial [Thermoplasmata archaeon]